MEVADAAVVSEGDNSSTKLVAYVVLKSSPAYRTQEWEKQWRETLRAALKRKLPEYMVPSEWKLIDSLPLDLSGKLDRSLLPKIETPSEASDEAGLLLNDTERGIAGIWKQVLKIEDVGADENFFDVGGKSLLIPEVHLALENSLHRNIQIVDLFQYPRSALWLSTWLRSK